MRWPRWQRGRGGTGYRKLLLAQGRTWDFYVIDYPAGVALHEHTDPVDGRRHFRVNVRLRGDDTYVGESLWRTPRIVVFRPDIMPHGAGASKTRRVLLSFGCAR